MPDRLAARCPHCGRLAAAFATQHCNPPHRPCGWMRCPCGAAWDTRNGNFIRPIPKDKP